MFIFRYPLEFFSYFNFKFSVVLLFDDYFPSFLNFTESKTRYTVRLPMTIHMFSRKAIGSSSKTVIVAMISAHPYVWNWQNVTSPHSDLLYGRPTRTSWNFLRQDVKNWKRNVTLRSGGDICFHFWAIERWGGGRFATLPSVRGLLRIREVRIWGISNCPLSPALPPSVPPPYGLS